MEYEKSIKELKYIKRVLGLIQLLSLITLFISPLFWIWLNWELCWKLALSSLLIIIICTLFYHALKNIIDRS